MKNNSIHRTEEKKEIVARDIAFRSRSSSLLYLVIFAIIIGFTPFYSDYKYFTTGIGISLVIATVIRGICVWNYTSLYQYSPAAWFMGNAIGTLIQAGAWGILSIMSIHYYGWDWPTMVICLSAAAFAAGAVTTLSGSFKLTFVYLIFIFSPTFVVTIIAASEESLIAAFLFGTYWLFLINVANRLNKEYWSALENSYLLQQRAEELEEKNRELESFAYSVSHDLRAPLRSIDGFSNILLEDAWSKLNDNERDYLRRVRSAAQKMGELIDDLLQLSKVSRANYSPETINLSELIHTNLIKHKKLDPQRQIDFEIEPNLQANGDRSLLEIAIGNLLDNAWKYSSKREQSKIRFGAKRENGEVVYYIKDNGVGFDTRYVNKLFGPFQRLHTNEEFPGTGIGLATVHRIIDRHGGKIWANAKVDKGATFYFTIHGDVK